MPGVWRPRWRAAVTDRPLVHAKLAGDGGAGPPAGERAVDQVGVQALEAKVGRPGGELVVGGAAELVRGGHVAGWWGQVGVVEEAANDTVSGAEFLGDLGGAGGLLAPRGEVVVKAGEAMHASMPGGGGAAEGQGWRSRR